MVGTAGGVHGDRDAAAVVGDLDAAVAEDLHVHPGGVTGHRFVDRVVDDLPHQVVQTALTGGADVHARSFADGLEPLQNRDGLGAVFVLCLLLWGSHGRNDLLGVSHRRLGHRIRSAASLPSTTVTTDSEAAFLHS